MRIEKGTANPAKKMQTLCHKRSQIFIFAKEWVPGLPLEGFLSSFRYGLARWSDVFRVLSLAPPKKGRRSALNLTPFFEILHMSGNLEVTGIDQKMHADTCEVAQCDYRRPFEMPEKRVLATGLPH